MNYIKLNSIIFTFIFYYKSKTLFVCLYFKQKFKFNLNYILDFKKKYKIEDILLFL